jgi:NAD(P)-dependent dehydrogenase (short-subunit alcohol dehydrogenase family)
MKLKDNVLIIVGGTSGIGLSAAQALKENGANLVILGKDDNYFNEASNLLGKDIEIIKGDARKKQDIEGLFELTIKKYGRIDGLYHVAGGSGRRFGDGPLHELSLEGWNKTFEMNLTSLMLSNQAAVKQFLKQKKGGSILNLASILAYSPSPHFFSTHAYAAAKAAIIGFSKSLASYYAKDNIRVNVLAPGLVETPMAQRAAKDTNIMSFIETKQPLDGGRIGHADDLAEASVYFLSSSSSFVTGQVLAVDGGWSVTEGQT